MPTATPIPVLSSVTVALQGSLDTLVPLFSQSDTARAIDSLIFVGLLGQGSRGELVPDLAESWSSADGVTYTFRIRADARWQDGQPVTARDVAYTVALAHDPTAPIAADLRDALKGVTVQTPDPLTAQLTGPPGLGAGLLDLATLPILPAHILSAVSPAQVAALPFAARPIGDGPYLVRSADAFQVVLQRAAPDSEAPDRVVINVTPSDSVAAKQLLDHQADVAVLAQPNAMPPDVAHTPLPLAQPVMLFLNMRRPALADPRVRQALDLAIDRTALSAGQVADGAKPLRLPLSPDLWMADRSAQVPGFDRQRAADLLTAAGWAPAAGNIRRRDGSALHLDLVVTDDPTRVRVAQAIAADWKNIGIEVIVESAGIDGLLRDFGLPGQFDALLLAVSQQGAAPALLDLWHSGSAMNLSAWTDPLADAALDATKSPDEETRRIGYQRFQRRFADTLPAIPLYLPNVEVASRNVSITPGILDTPADVLRSIPSWRPGP